MTRKRLYTYFILGPVLISFSTRFIYSAIKKQLTLEKEIDALTSETTEAATTYYNINLADACFTGFFQIGCCVVELPKPYQSIDVSDNDAYYKNYINQAEIYIHSTKQALKALDAQQYIIDKKQKLLEKYEKNGNYKNTNIAEEVHNNIKYTVITFQNTVNGQVIAYAIYAGFNGIVEVECLTYQNDASMLSDALDHISFSDTSS